MNTKVCVECGKTFKAKRSDATCCSDKCRSSFNYKRKVRKNHKMQFDSNSDILNTSEMEIELSGKLELTHLNERVGSFEKHILGIKDEIRKHESKSDDLNHHMVTLKQQIVTMEMGDMLQLKKRAEMSDFALFNNYLNTDYQTAKQNGDKYAKSRLKTKDDVESKFNHELKLQILNYRSKLSAKLEKLNWELQGLQEHIDSLKFEQEQHIAKTTELVHEMRFYEARILKYESLLTG